MQVNPSGMSPQVARPTSETATPSVGPATGGEEATGLAGVSSFQPTADLTKLLAAVRAAPDVRADAVASAAARLAAGAYDTPEAAGDAARAYLDGGAAAR